MVQLPLPVSQLNVPSTSVAVTFPEPVSALTLPPTFSSVTSPLPLSKRRRPWTPSPCRGPTWLRKAASTAPAGTCTSTSAYSSGPSLEATRTLWPSYLRELPERDPKRLLTIDEPPLPSG